MYKYMGGRHSAINVPVMQVGEGCKHTNFFYSLQSHSIVGAHIFGVFFPQDAYERSFISIGCPMSDKNKVALGTFWRVAVCTFCSVRLLHIFALNKMLFCFHVWSTVNN